MAENYYNEINKLRTIKLRKLYKELPLFARDFFRSIETTTTTLTRLNYAHDLKLFFNYLSNESIKIKGKTPIDITIKDLSLLELRDIEMFVEYLSFYYNEEKQLENNPSGKARKISTLKSFFKYFYKRDELKSNICALIDTPKIHDKPITRLEPNEIADLLDLIESGEGLTESQKKYHKKTYLRDLALVTLMLSTGIRVSEVVGLNISDINFENSSFRVTRKGGNVAILYFGDESEKALFNYLDQRKLKNIFSVEDPLFLNLQNTRLGVRSVQNLVKKYAKLASPLKNISPHKLRSTFGTYLYNETGDIYLVADILGHKDVNTTRKHYAKILEDRRKDAKNVIKLRD